MHKWRFTRVQVIFFFCWTQFRLFLWGKGKRERDLGADLDHLAEWVDWSFHGHFNFVNLISQGAHAVVTLVEQEELVQLRVGDTKER